jgi:hypothetical protein
MMTIEYGYNEESALHADDVANRIDSSAAYVCSIEKAEAVLTDKGTQGVLLGVRTANGEEGEFTLYLRRDDGTEVFGMKLMQAIMLITGVRGLRSVPGRVERWDNELGERAEVDGETFPDLLKKKCGLVFQRENYRTSRGRDAFRINLYGVYHPETLLTATEIKGKVSSPAKLHKILKGLKDRNSIKETAHEPAQASMAGIDSGNF